MCKKMVPKDGSDNGYFYLTFVALQMVLVTGTSFSAMSRTVPAKPLFALKWPLAIVPNILSIDFSDGRQELNMQKCRLRRAGISFRPPPDKVDGGNYL